jgi:hypothetical protein
VPAQAKGKILSYSRKTDDVVWKECWEVKSQQENKISVVKMRILRWICGKTVRLDMIELEMTKVLPKLKGNFIIQS